MGAKISKAERAVTPGIGGGSAAAFIDERPVLSDHALFSLRFFLPGYFFFAFPEREAVERKDSSRLMP